jgi:hypothetical protein
MLFASSVIRKTGQWWKVTVAFWAVIFGIGFVAHDVSQIGVSVPDRPPVFAMLGSSLVLTGFVIAWMAVRCQNCGARWIWLAMTEQVAGNWMTWLFAQSQCPRCHK